MWFHPLLWLTGSRVALYRELSCDSSVLEGSSGGFLVSALAKLTSPENDLVLRSAATSLVARRLDRPLAPAAREANRWLNAAVLGDCDQHRAALLLIALGMASPQSATTFRPPRQLPHRPPSFATLFIIEYSAL